MLSQYLIIIRDRLDNMYLPLYLNVYLPEVSTDHFEVEPDYFDEIKNILNRAWRDVNAWLFLPEKKSSAGFYNYHRAPQDMYGDNGYIRLAGFLNLVLHSSWKGRTVYTLINTRTSAATKVEDIATYDVGDPFVVPSSLKDRVVYVDDETKDILTYFFKLPAVNSFNAKLIKIDEIREQIDKFVSCSFLSSGRRIQRSN